MPFTRRDILFGLGGGLAGVAFTPVPWKLLDDTAIWTQRRHAIPVPPRGPVTFRSAACTLCPAGCALRVRCVGPRPVAVAGEGGHPLGGGGVRLRADPAPPRLPPAAPHLSGRARERTDGAGRPRRGGRDRRARRPDGPHERPEGDGPRPAPGPGRLDGLARADGRAPARTRPLRDPPRRGRDAGRAAASDRSGRPRSPRPRPREDADPRELRGAGPGRMGTARRGCWPLGRGCGSCRSTPGARPPRRWPTSGSRFRRAPRARWPWRSRT